MSLQLSWTGKSPGQDQLPLGSSREWEGAPVAPAGPAGGRGDLRGVQVLAGLQAVWWGCVFLVPVLLSRSPRCRGLETCPAVLSAHSAHPQGVPRPAPSLPPPPGGAAGISASAQEAKGDGRGCSRNKASGHREAGPWCSSDRGGEPGHSNS